MQKFAVIDNREKDSNGTAALMVKDYLSSRGAACDILPLIGSGVGKIDMSYLAPGTECVIVVGGDGTMIRAARELYDTGIPLIGVNFGTLGYLTEIAPDKLTSALDRLLAGEGEVEERMMLYGRLIRDGKPVCEDIALNDIVFTRGDAMSVIRFTVTVNGELLNQYSADGMIIATPTGSTAYNLSVGGPIVAPNASLILMSPISPHSLVNRSIVLPDYVTIGIRLLPKGTHKPEGRVAFDGGKSLYMGEGDILEIERSQKTARILKLSRISFVENLRRKMSPL